MLLTKVKSDGTPVFRITVYMSVCKNTNVLNYNPTNSHPVQCWLWGFGAESYISWALCSLYSSGEERI